MKRSIGIAIVALVVVMMFVTANKSRQAEGQAMLDAETARLNNPQVTNAERRDIQARQARRKACAALRAPSNCLEEK